MESLILSIDQGTSSTKVLLMNSSGKIVKETSAPLETTYFPNGFVEQNPFDLLESVKKAVLASVEGIKQGQIKSIGISNQRETFIVWDKNGTPLAPAIVWACKRSKQICNELQEQNEWIKEKTGLLIDPYFSATKLLWLIQNNTNIKNILDAGELYFGTVDTWILFSLSRGKSFACDLTNASRTLLMNLKTQSWDQEILHKWQLKKLNLPEIKHSSDDFGTTNLFGWSEQPIPINSMIGDSHAALFGEACFGFGDTKMTLGTGCSLLINLGNQPLKSNAGLLTTIGWSTKEQVVYAWEGAIVSCGSMVEWLKNSLNLINDPVETANLALSVNDSSGVYLVPSFSGLGAPFWEMERKASFVGLTLGTTPAHLVKATLDSIVFQIKAVLDAMELDLGKGIQQISINGGLSKNTYIQNALIELLKSNIFLQNHSNISAQGAAFLAGLQSGIFKDLPSLKQIISTQHLEKKSISKARMDSFNEWKTIIQSNKF